MTRQRVLVFDRGSSLGLTYLNSTGPMPYSTIVDSVAVVYAKWFMFAGISAYPPTGSVLFVGSLRELVAHAERQRAGDDHDVLVGRMRVRRNRVVRRKLQADRVRNRFRRIAGQDRDLRARREHRRRRAPLGLFQRGDDVTVALGRDADGRRHQRERAHELPHEILLARTVATGAGVPRPTGGSF